ncbi:SPFH domain-containing protein [Aeromicrobium terrae]|uniref:SPFH domain-containing protein n=1 Tax=Aeromicrobium terrae TaxID=2498846 RepID=UPI001C9CB4AF|nr:SPFH domain-containing protein [Aeromicrobium terrae]
MATITNYPFARHVRTTATGHLLHLSGGRRRHSGAGAAFWFRPMSAAISEVPVEDREHTLLVPVRTSDLHQIAVPLTVSFRFAEPELAAARVDFSVDLRSGLWTENPLEVVGSMITGGTVAAATSAFAGLSLAEALAVDPDEVRTRVLAAMRSDERLRSVGVEVIGVRISLVRPEPDVEKALQTPAREAIQQEADKATFERRALAVEREAAIGENELANEIELARRRQQLIEENGANARREAEEAAAAEQIATEAKAQRIATLAETRAEAERLTGAAEAENERARMAAYDGVPQELVLALAMRGRRPPARDRSGHDHA